MTVAEAQENIIAEFAQLDDWLDKYERLIRHGKTLSSPGNSLRSDRNALQGCQSRVWIEARQKEGRIFFSADSDSLVIKGVLALLVKTLEGRSPEEIATTDLYFIREIGLSTHLSPARANGVALIVARMIGIGTEARA